MKTTKTTMTALVFVTLGSLLACGGPLPEDAPDAASGDSAAADAAAPEPFYVGTWQRTTPSAGRSTVETFTIGPVSPTAPATTRHATTVASWQATAGYDPAEDVGCRITDTMAGDWFVGPDADPAEVVFSVTTKTRERAACPDPARDGREVDPPSVLDTLLLRVTQDGPGTLVLSPHGGDPGATVAWRYTAVAR